MVLEHTSGIKDLRANTLFHALGVVPASAVCSVLRQASLLAYVTMYQGGAFQTLV